MMNNIRLHKGSLIDRLKNHDGYSTIITILNDEVVHYPSNIGLDAEDKSLIHIVVDKKGYFRGTKADHKDRGKYMTISKLCGILEENPDWIRIKKVSNKFGL